MMEEMKVINLLGKLPALSLPPGFRFHPSDDELISFYLKGKVFNSGFAAHAIAEVDLNKHEPWDLPEKANIGEKDQWYFFTLRDRKYPTGMRTNRATVAGYWKATGKDRDVVSPLTSRLVGMKKTLVFYIGRAPRGEKTDWIMHEYRLEGNEGNFSRCSKTTSSKEWVVCRVFQKKAGIKKNLTRRTDKVDDSNGGSEPASPVASSALPQLRTISEHIGGKKIADNEGDFPYMQTHQNPRRIDVSINNKTQEDAADENPLENVELIAAKDIADWPYYNQGNGVTIRAGNVPSSVRSGFVEGIPPYAASITLTNKTLDKNFQNTAKFVSDDFMAGTEQKSSSGCAPLIVSSCNFDYFVQSITKSSTCCKLETTFSSNSNTGSDSNAFTTAPSSDGMQLSNWFNIGENNNVNVACDNVFGIRKLLSLQLVPPSMQLAPGMIKAAHNHDLHRIVGHVDDEMILPSYQRFLRNHGYSDPSSGLTGAQHLHRT